MTRIGLFIFLLKLPQFFYGPMITILLSILLYLNSFFHNSLYGEIFLAFQMEK